MERQHGVAQRVPAPLQASRAVQTAAARAPCAALRSPRGPGAAALRAPRPARRRRRCAPPRAPPATQPVSSASLVTVTCHYSADTRTLTISPFFYSQIENTNTEFDVMILYIVHRAHISFCWTIKNEFIKLSIIPNM